MAKFVEFEDDSDIPVSINPDHVVKVAPEGSDRANIYLWDNEWVCVKATYAEVVKKLSGA